VIFKPRNRDRLITDFFHVLLLMVANFVSQFKYSGHIISDTRSTNDDDGLRRETRNLVVRTNALISKFYRCCINVKLMLFKTFCLYMYDVALWKYYSVTVFNKFKSAHDKCIQKFCLC